MGGEGGGHKGRAGVRASNGGGEWLAWRRVSSCCGRESGSPYFLAAYLPAAPPRPAARHGHARARGCALGTAVWGEGWGWGAGPHALAILSISALDRSPEKKTMKTDLESASVAPCVPSPRPSGNPGELNQGRHMELKIPTRSVT